MPIKGRSHAPTQGDVARLAGVTQGTVSAVLNGRARAHRIPEATELRVREAAAELGYVANPAARSLRGKRNRLLGVHTFESVFPLDEGNFFHEFLLGIEKQAVVEGYDMVLFTSTEDATGRRRIYREGANRLNVADGSVLLGFAQDVSDIVRLAGEGYPFVHIGRREVPGAEFRWVGADYRAGTAAIIARLVRLGHERIGYLSPDRRSEALADREDGYRDGCSAADVPALVDLLEVEQMSAEWFDRAVADGVTAFVTANEDYAARLAELTRARGLTIPEDVSVVVLRGTAAGPRPGVSWSGMGIPRNEMGRVATRMLVEILRDPHATQDEHILLPCAPPEETTMAPAKGATA
ncbi:LacI family DNA-binding transcriptional regulator [Ruania alba]|uniref:DNA-binding transcriptional regulator, LacI/PurR family n=1 Tax=Ruania alba TaxID=648782 RepID=A0A1H5MH41_9MICO|nr:LacI family DNA-binding transcriptional regulator [Ruania alba]SEE88689.1 DNA-binding transcriptional regulator, LacI/PurR family [Ruania alba]